MVGEGKERVAARRGTDGPARGGRRRRAPGVGAKPADRGKIFGDEGYIQKRIGEAGERGHAPTLEAAPGPSRSNVF